MKTEVMVILQELITKSDAVTKAFEASFMAGPGVTAENTAAFVNGRLELLKSAAQQIEEFYDLTLPTLASMRGFLDRPDPMDYADETAADKIMRDLSAKGDADMDKRRAGE